jgi:CRISPR-associated protein Csm3
MESKNLKFLGNVLVAYRLRLLTGLHIGGMKSSFEIGSLDNPVIKLPEGIDFSFKSFFNDGEDGKEKEIKVKGGTPFIPGSSIKGKLRSLLEWKYGLVELKEKKREEGRNVEDLSPEAKRVLRLFGRTPHEVKEEEVKEYFPIRGRFFDLYPVSEIGETEIKAENTIDRLTAKATPRFMERVPAGTVFEGLIVIKLFSEDDAELLSILKEGFKLLEDDYLGGSGSRGYGRVELEKVRIIFRPKEYYEGYEDNENRGEVLSETPLTESKEDDFRDVFDEAKRKLVEKLSKTANSNGKGEKSGNGGA